MPVSWHRRRLKGIESGHSLCFPPIFLPVLQGEPVSSQTSSPPAPRWCYPGEERCGLSRTQCPLLCCRRLEGLRGRHPQLCVSSINHKSWLPLPPSLLFLPLGWAAGRETSRRLFSPRLPLWPRRMRWVPAGHPEPLLSSGRAGAWVLTRSLSLPLPVGDAALWSGGPWRMHRELDLPRGHYTKLPALNQVFTAFCKGAFGACSTVGQMVLHYQFDYVSQWIWRRIRTPEERSSEREAPSPWLWKSRMRH